MTGHHCTILAIFLRYGDKNSTERRRRHPAHRRRDGEDAQAQEPQGALLAELHRAGAVIGADRPGVALLQERRPRVHRRTAARYLSLTRSCATYAIRYATEAIAIAHVSAYS